MITRLWQWLNKSEDAAWMDYGWASSPPRTSWRGFFRSTLRGVSMIALFATLVGFPLFLIGAGWRAAF